MNIAKLHEELHEKKQTKQIILAVVGPMASGKNLVSKILEDEGFLSIDADLLTHSIIEENKEIILETFQNQAKKANISLLDNEGRLNRKALGALLFANPHLLQKQEALIHPLVNECFNAFIEANPDKNIVLNATLLYKTAIIKRCDFILYVKSSAILRFFRVRKRDSLTFRQIFHRFWAQRKIFSHYKKLDADILIVRNYSSIRCLKTQILNILKKSF